MSEKEAAEYKRRYDEFLVEIARRLQQHIGGLLRGTPRVDRIVARAKSPDRFAVKAAKEEDGRRKYRSPLTEIQDQVGARIIVFYTQDVDSVRAKIVRYFQPIEQRELVPESEWAFGYFGMHLVLPMPADAVPEGVPADRTPRFFELQIKTLFQHSWSEAEHDLGYKAIAPLTDDQKRRLAFTAAQAWGADRVFAELFSELNAAN